MNEVTLIGNVGKDPQTRNMPNGGIAAKINIATSKEWRDKSTGEQKKKTEWHRVVIYGKQAEYVANYVKQGSELMVRGELQTRKWQDAEGRDQHTTEVVVQGFDGKIKGLGHPKAQG